MSAVYLSYTSECAVSMDEPPTCTCLKCREEFPDVTGRAPDFCDDCMDQMSRQIDSGREQPR